MDLKPLLLILGLILLGGFMMIGLFGAALISGGLQNQGETIGQASTGPVEPGSLSEDVPAVLAAVFKQPADSGIATPAALLAAISLRECGRLWTPARKTPDLIQNWIDNNIDVDNRGCSIPNSAGAAGPMQFLAGTFAGLASQVSQLTKHTPASRLNIRDAVFAAGLKLREDSRVHGPFQGSWRKARLPTKTSINQWQEEDVYWAAYHYQGDCGGGYCEEIVRNWKKFGKLDQP